MMIRGAQAVTMREAMILRIVGLDCGEEGSDVGDRDLHCGRVVVAVPIAVSPHGDPVLDLDDFSGINKDYCSL